MKIKRPVLEIGQIPAFERPRYIDQLVFPADITQLAAANISELMGKYAAICAFVDQEATTWSMRVLELEREIESAEASFMTKHPKLAFLQRWQIQNRISQDLAIRLLNRDLVRARSFRERAQSLVRIYERLISVLSRELSRRVTTSDGSRHSFR